MTDHVEEGLRGLAGTKDEHFETVSNYGIPECSIDSQSDDSRERGKFVMEIMFLQLLKT